MPEGRTRRFPPLEASCEPHRPRIGLAWASHGPRMQLAHTACEPVSHCAGPSRMLRCAGRRRRLRPAAPLGFALRPGASRPAAQCRPTGRTPAPSASAACKVQSTHWSFQLPRLAHPNAIAGPPTAALCPALARSCAASPPSRERLGVLSAGEATGRGGKGCDARVQARRRPRCRCWRRCCARCRACTISTRSAFLPGKRRLPLPSVLCSQTLVALVTSRGHLSISLAETFVVLRCPLLRLLNWRLRGTTGEREVPALPGAYQACAHG